MCKEKFVNPFTDFGFKRLFGTESNKDILIHFLNTLLEEDEEEIVDLTYLNVEKIGHTEQARRAVYDIYCKLANGNHIIVEMQKASQEHFIDRTIYYSARAIDDAAKRGDWDFELPRIYTISLLNFCPEEFKNNPSYLHKARLCDLATGREFSRKLTYIYLEIKKFDKDIDQIETFTEKWMYVIKNLYLFERYPEKLKESIFQRFFDEARISAFTDKERFAYEESLKELWDYQNTLATAKKEGKAEGIIEGKAEEKIESAKRMLQDGLPIDIVCKYTQLSPDEVKVLQKGTGCPERSETAQV